MDITFSDAAVRFLDHCRVAKTLSSHTLRAYETDLAHARARLGSAVPVGEIDRDRLRRYIGGMLNDEGLKETSVKRRLATIKQLFKWLEREDILALNPFHRFDLTIRLPRRLPRALGVADIRKLMRAAAAEAEIRRTQLAQQMYFVVVVLFVSGLRVGELVGIRLSDVDAEAATIVVRGKGNRERRVYLPGDEARALLHRHLAERMSVPTDGNVLLTSPTGAAITPQYIRRSLALLAERAGLSRRVTPHMLRHTAATQLIEAGVDIRFVQKLLGHASIATTQIYTQVSDASLKATLEQADTLGRLVGDRER
ncbi:MAG: tyrosine-type recombinase/integrase [Alphaproteobacteria bacterium]|nr:tyrosine-type recombinase/integrase [Alphaproteobacteria bacterium]